MQLFHEDGHLTPQGLQAIIDGELDELQSLEAAEHLSFCDTCLAGYTRLLTNDVLIEPQQPLKEPVLRQIRKRALRIVRSRYATVAAAACLAIGLWFSGSFAIAALPARENPPRPDTQQQVSLGQRLNNTTDTITTHLNDFFQNLLRGPAPGANDADQAEDGGQTPNSTSGTSNG